MDLGTILGFRRRVGFDVCLYRSESILFRKLRFPDDYLIGQSRCGHSGKQSFDSVSSADSVNSVNSAYSMNSSDNADSAYSGDRHSVDVQIV